MRKILTIFVCALALVSILSISNAFAANAGYATIYTADGSNNQKVEFAINEKVYIHYSIQSGKTADITVSLGGTVDRTWTGVSGTGVISDYTPSLGKGVYGIACTGVEKIVIAVGGFFVIPELPFGTVMAAVAGFGAFGLLKLKQTKYGKIYSYT